MCLHPKCDAFWCRRDGGNPSTEELEYNPHFLILKPCHPLSEMVDICPDRPKETDGCVATGYASRSGWHCRSCGRVSVRWENCSWSILVFFNGNRAKWEHCECAHCGVLNPTTSPTNASNTHSSTFQLIYKPKGRIRISDEFKTINIATKFEWDRVLCSSGESKSPAQPLSKKLIWLQASLSNRAWHGLTVEGKVICKHSNFLPCGVSHFLTHWPFLMEAEAVYMSFIMAKAWTGPQTRYSAFIRKRQPTGAYNSADVR